MQVFNPKKSIITVDRGVAVRATLLPAGTMRNVTTERRIDTACSAPARLVKRPKMQSWIPTLFPSIKRMQLAFRGASSTSYKNDSQNDGLASDVIGLQCSPSQPFLASRGQFSEYPPSMELTLRTMVCAIVVRNTTTGSSRRDGYGWSISLCRAGTRHLL